MAKKKSILLVEDNSNDEFLTVTALRECNAANDIVVAHDGVEALDYLLNPDPGGKQHTLPQFVLLDIKLPKIDGLEVLKRIREDDRTRKLPVIILTSSKEETDLERCYALGANSYICKPVDFGQFMNSIKQLGTYWLTLNEYPEC